MLSEHACLDIELLGTSLTDRVCVCVFWGHAILAAWVDCDIVDSCQCSQSQGPSSYSLLVVFQKLKFPVCGLVAI